MRRGEGASDLMWGALGVALLAGGWSWINRASGPFVLPSLGDTGLALVRIIRSADTLPTVAATLEHALGGVAIGAGIGFMVGLAGGFARPIGATIAPIATAILGVPPIAWVVLALLWFGPGGLGPLFTVAITAMPIVFAASLQGVRSRDPQLAEMARVFRLPMRSRLFRIMLPELATILAPALATTFAMAWKVALMAEVLGDGSGIGGRFATARAHLDLPEAMAWIVIVVSFVLISDVLLLGRLRRWVGRCRAPALAQQSRGAASGGGGAMRDKSC
ncbi:ABC transporter permease [Rhodopseudomonas palustris]|uniref:Binding-protein-dependent transport systems inner membrane component n=1 Tax=Rhodopseudomonas palustris (strain BisB18) TaxID=316056 RepID=Q217E7_RHOPB